VPPLGSDQTRREDANPRPQTLAGLRLIRGRLRRRGARVDHALGLQNAEHRHVKIEDFVVILIGGAVDPNGHNEIVSGKAGP